MSRTPNPLTNPPSNPQILSLFNPGKTLRHLKQFHAQIITHHNSPFQLSALASLSALSPFPTFLAYAKTIFHHLQNPPPSLYNSLIRALSSSKTPLEALPLHHTMLQSGLKPDHMTVGTLHLYANGKDLGAAKQLFNLCSDRDLVSWNAMIDGYVKRGEMGHARIVFDRMVCRDVISWNTMINGYAIVGKIDEAKRLFDEMLERILVSWNSMLAGFVKCGNVEDAFGLFSEMPCGDVVSWNSMLACYAQCGKPNEALALFDHMRAVGVKPTEATVVSLLSACAHLGALDKGLHLHTYINDNRIEVNSIVGTALVDMYAKCGKISLATQVFNAMESKDVLAWNTIIAGMAIHGHVKEAQQLFKEMKEAGVEPNDITFVAMLSACSHAGMVDEGLLEEAMELIGTMPMEPNPCALGALLGGCRIGISFIILKMVNVPVLIFGRVSVKY
ncbi:Pentatricopeptide repeat-containing protein [Vitis vinifera]|uniref:Pentatricopeptide repeat-containing protein n=1 Tax=Vitis vinifera TaxID=29760 RepID=A0A438C1V1_VITVI|nr:Pentatricopeptide repeat-containing protein [Vitis vinifera]